MHRDTTPRWLAWVDIPDRRGDDGARVRRYVTHGVPFFLLTPFRSAAARYQTREAAQTIASFAAGSSCPFGVEPAPPLLTSGREPGC